MLQKTLHMAAALSLAAMAFPAAGLAQADYPNKPINFVVPYGPGGTVDPTARVLGESVSKILGQPVVVVNKPGAAGSIGTEFVARSDPDGYTVLIHTNIVASEVCLKTNLTYKFLDEMKPVMSLVETPFVLLANPSSIKANTVKEIVELLKANPGKIRHGASGVGSSGHLRGEQFSVMTGTKMTYIPFKDGGGTLLGLVRDDINISFDTLPGSLPLIKDGKIKLIAVSTDKRWPTVPDTPTMKEAGYPGLASQWIGAFVPAKTPPAVVKKLSDAMTKALAEPEVKERFTKMSFAITGTGPEQLAKELKEETASWCDTIKKAGIKIEQ